MNEKNIVIIWIKEFPIKSIAMKGRYFRRVGNSNRVMTMQEIAQMHFRSVAMSGDKPPARIYDDESIVWSPGGLSFGITLEELYKSPPLVSKNKGIASIFCDMGWIEQWGSGKTTQSRDDMFIARDHPNNHQSLWGLNEFIL